MITRTLRDKDITLTTDTTSGLCNSNSCDVPLYKSIHKQ